MNDAPLLCATPFHARAADANRHNAWVVRNGVTLSADYGDVATEALRARLNVAMADISWRWRAMLEGPQAGEFLKHLVTRDIAELPPGLSLKALWLSDRGGVRGAGVVARHGRDSFQLIASASDAEWIAAAANAFDVRFRDVSAETGGLAIVGRFARETLEEAELAADITPLAFRKLSWRGIDITLSRFGEHEGYEIWCAPDDGLLVWDRIMQAGRRFAIVPAGVAAMDVLDCEAGIARPQRDYVPARDGEAASPSPRALGLEKLIDAGHGAFNGYAAWLAARDRETKTLVGVEISADTPAPFTPLLRDGMQIGHTLQSVYSPAMRRAIALASVDIKSAIAGTVLSLTLPPSMYVPELRKASARVVELPFLAAPGAVDSQGG